jgi:hypothetical protein
MGKWHYAFIIIDFGIRWRSAPTFSPLSLYSRENTPDTHKRGGWMICRAGLDTVEERKICHYRQIELQFLGGPVFAVQLVARRYTD